MNIGERRKYGHETNAVATLRKNGVAIASKILVKHLLVKLQLLTHHTNPKFHVVEINKPK